MNEKPTLNEIDREPQTATDHKEDTSVSSPRVKTLLTGGLGVKSGVRAGAGHIGGPKLPPASGD